MSDLIPVMPKYEVYNDSGVEWIGEIPVDWDLKRLKYIVGINQNSLTEVTPATFEMKYVDIGSVSYEKGIEKTEFFLFKDSPSRARRIAKEDDTIISTVRTYLKAIDYIDKKKRNYIYSTGFAILCPKDNIYSKFLISFIRSDSFTNQVDIKSKGMSYPAINSTDLSNLIIAIPTVQEQNSIANFLDCKTTKIDQAVAIKKKQIHLLKERKQLLIQNAVTQGLNPNVPMRDSGVEWIDEIPKHWDVKRFKNLFTQSRLMTRPNDGVVTSYRDGQVTLRSNRRLSGYTEAILEQGYQGIRRGQLVLNSMDAFEGAIGVSDSDGKCTPEYVICDSISNELLPEYFAFLLREMALAKYIQVICNAVRQRAVRIRFNNLKGRFLVVPPIEEQTAIVTHIQIGRAHV